MLICCIRVETLWAMPVSDGSMGFSYNILYSLIVPVMYIPIVHTSLLKYMTLDQACHLLARAIMMLPLTGMLYKLTPPMQHVGLKRHLSVYIIVYGFMATWPPLSHKSLM